MDYDGTWTHKPEVSLRIYQAVRDSGEIMICATSRIGTESDKDELMASLPEDMPIVWCGSQWKREAVKAEGYEVLFWIDDQPNIIGGPGVLWLMRLRGIWLWVKDKFKWSQK
jgi:hypothetical protein